MSLSNLIGTQAFLPALIAHIRDSATSPTVPLDPVIFQSILLCLIAGERHLILRTPEEDVALTVQLTVWTLSCIFNMPTRKLKIRPRSTARSTSTRTKSAPTSATTTHTDTAIAFLRSLFIPHEDETAENTRHVRTPSYQSRATNPKPRRPHSEHHVSNNHVSNAAQRHTSVVPLEHSPWILNRSEDIDTENRGLLSALPPAADHGVASSTAQGSSSISHNAVLTGPQPTIIRPKPIYPRGAPGSRLPHAYTDPFLETDHRRRKSSGGQSQAELPRALVVSNLEDASDIVQRALAQVLAERKVILPDRTWSLAEDFIAVYVCPWNATERPAIHKTLLDKFAMSANAFVSQTVRRDLRMLPFSSRSITAGEAHSTPGSPAPMHAMALPTHTPPATTRALPPLVHQRAATYPMPQHIHPPLFSLPEVIPASLLADLRTSYRHTQISPRLELYLADIFSATRHHPQLDAMLLTARAHADSAALARAARVLGNDLTGAELLRPPSPLQQLAEDDSTRDARSTESEFDEEEEEDYRSALDMWVEHEHEHEHAPLMSLGDGASGSQEADAATAPRSLDVSEVNIARVVPRVVSHRVWLRAGPEEEVLASAIFGATFRPTAVPSGQGERLDSVKAALVQILAEV